MPVPSYNLALLTGLKLRDHDTNIDPHRMTTLDEGISYHLVSFRTREHEINNEFYASRGASAFGDIDEDAIEFCRMCGIDPNDVREIYI